MAQPNLFTFFGSPSDNDIDLNKYLTPELLTAGLSLIGPIMSMARAMNESVNKQSTAAPAAAPVVAAAPVALHLAAQFLQLVRAPVAAGSLSEYCTAGTTGAYIAPTVDVPCKQTDDFMQWEAVPVPVIAVPAVPVPATLQCLVKSSIVQDDLVRLRKSYDLYVDTVTESSADDTEYKYVLLRSANHDSSTLATRVILSPVRLTFVQVTEEYNTWFTKITAN